MLDIAVAYNRYKFLGFEFLLWLWFIIEKRPDLLQQLDPQVTALTVGNRVVLENRTQRGIESILIKGDDPGLEEGKMALQKGAALVEMNLVLSIAERNWRFTLKGESMDVSNLKTPEAAERQSDTDDMILDKLDLYEPVFNLIDQLYRRYIQLRLENGWESQTAATISDWIYG